MNDWEREAYRALEARVSRHGEQLARQDDRLDRLDRRLAKLENKKGVEGDEPVNRKRLAVTVGGGMLIAAIGPAFTALLSSSP